MTPPPATYTWIDDVALSIGLGVVLLGSVVMGFVETVVGSESVTHRIAELGIVVTLHPSVGDHLRATIIALGFLLLVAWASYRVIRSLSDASRN